jgi:hypothetical protein
MAEDVSPHLVDGHDRGQKKDLILARLNLCDSQIRGKGGSVVSARCLCIVHPFPPFVNGRNQAGGLLKSCSLILSRRIIPASRNTRLSLFLEVRMSPHGGVKGSF